MASHANSDGILTGDDDPFWIATGEELVKHPQTSSAWTPPVLGNDDTTGPLFGTPFPDGARLGPWKGGGGVETDWLDGDICIEPSTPELISTALNECFGGSFTLPEKPTGVVSSLPVATAENGPEITGFWVIEEQAAPSTDSSDSGKLNGNVMGNTQIQEKPGVSADLDVLVDTATPCDHIKEAISHDHGYYCDMVSVYTIDFNFLSGG